LAAVVPFGNAELYRAIWDGNEGRALDLIKAGGDPNSTWAATHSIETENRAMQLAPLHFALARSLPRVAVADTTATYEWGPPGSSRRCLHRPT